MVASMSVLTKGGITRLSELTIDANKNWQAMGISNLKELAPAMARGDMLARGLAVLQRFQPGQVGWVLTSAGPLHMPSWQPPPGPLEYYFPVAIDLTHAEAIVPVDKSISKNAALATANIEAYLDDPAHNIKRLTPTLASSKAVSMIASADQSIAKNGPFTRAYDLQIVVGGAVSEHPAATYTTETTAAQNATTNDMNLPPVTPATNDAYYFGFAQMFDKVILKYDTAGAGVWTITWEYWNGAWVALAGVTDPTDNFTNGAATYTISFTRPGDWATTAVNGITLYWVRARVSAYTSQTTKPLGSQAWIVRNS